jgi:hypothetical protein
VCAVFTKRKYLILIASAATMIVIVVGILIIRRNSRLNPAQAKRYLHQHLPPSEWEPAARSTDITYTLREGDSLAKIAALRYGHQNFSGVIKLYNHIENVAAVQIGAAVRVPDISVILKEEGFTKVAPSETEMVLCSRAKYDKVKSQLAALRQDRPSGQRVVVPQKIKQELLEAADDLEQATQNLNEAKPGASRPSAKMIGQLQDAMRIMRELAEGSNDGYEYDIDMVQQRYALGLTYGIIWARDDFK